MEFYEQTKYIDLIESCCAMTLETLSKQIEIMKKTPNNYERKLLVAEEIYKLRMQNTNQNN